MINSFFLKKLLILKLEIEIKNWVNKIDRWLRSNVYVIKDKNREI